MQIVVVLPAGSTITLEVENADTVESVKQKIQEKEGVAVAQQRLMAGDQELADGQTLQHYAIGIGATLHLAVGTRSLTATPTSTTTATVEWSALHGASGYVVTWDGGSLTTSGTTATLTGLTPGALYTVTVTAAEGGAAGDPVTMTMPAATVPEQPVPTAEATIASTTSAATASQPALADTGLPAGDPVLLAALLLAGGAAFVRVAVRRPTR